MESQLNISFEDAPRSWKESAAFQECRLHQLAPYIGKLKPIIAHQLVKKYTSPGDVVLDCFAGSGTIPLEAALLGRHVLAFDANPYAVALTRAKLEAPANLEVANDLLMRRLTAADARPRYNEADIPAWVRKFFHPETLQIALRFADECMANDDQFLLVCLLSILHHQRPGFLSYPSSHLVPYLRDKKFPRECFPEMYAERALAPRLTAKLRRLYKHGQMQEIDSTLQVGQVNINNLNLMRSVDAIITSPPYMNALDYIRDNRLRMWFLDRNTTNYSPEPTEKQEEFDTITTAFARNAMIKLKSDGYCVLIVGETVLRKRVKSHPAERIVARLIQQYPTLSIEEVFQDEIPDVRRARRSGAATKRELIVVLRKQ